MTCLDFQRVNLPNPRLFRFLKFLAYPSNFLCISKALEASKVSPSERITAEQITAAPEARERVSCCVGGARPVPLASRHKGFSLF